MHLVKLAVGVESFDHLRVLQAARQSERGGCEVVCGSTRRKPRRAAEVLDGGSIYWVIKGAIRARQRIVGLEEAVDGAGKPFCQLLLDPGLAATVSLPKRAFQGWRYLLPEATPADLGDDPAAEGTDALPMALQRELRTLGLI